MPLPYLPSDILDHIFTIALSEPESIRSQIVDFHYYKIFSLVSKGWRETAQSRLLRAIEIRDSFQLDSVLCRLKEGNDDGLGNLVRSLRIGRSGSMMSTSTYPNRVGTEVNGTKKNLGGIESHEFIELITSLPQLVRMNLQSIQCYQFDSTSVSTSPLLPNLESLVLTTEPNDEDQGLLRFLLSHSPNLSQLHLIGSHRGPYSHTLPISSPPLQSFTITGQYYEFLLFSVNQALFPLSAYSKLEHFDVEGKVEFRGLSSILKEAGSTLISLRLRSILKASDLITTFPYLTRLNSLQTVLLIGLPEDFFDHLPITITILKVIITRSSLIHLQSHPRKFLSIQELYLPDNDIESIKLLTNSVKKVVFRQAWPSKVLEFLERNYEKTVERAAEEVERGVAGTKGKLRLEEIVLPKYRALDSQWENDKLRFLEFGGLKLMSGKVAPREGDII